MGHCQRGKSSLAPVVESGAGQGHWSPEHLTNGVNRMSIGTRVRRNTSGLACGAILAMLFAAPRPLAAQTPGAGSAKALFTQLIANRLVDLRGDPALPRVHRR